MEEGTREKEYKARLRQSKESATILIKTLLKVNKIPTPWQKALGAGVCTIVPLLLSYLYDKPQWGGIGMLGALVYLYTSYETYGRRSRKMIYVICGFTAVTFLGGITSDYVLLRIVLVGIIGGLGVFVFGTNRIPGPTAIFFVLIYLLTSVKPITLEATLENTIIMLVSCIFTGIIAMIGIILNPRKKEKETIERLYATIASYGRAIGSQDEKKIRNASVSFLKESEEFILSAHGAKYDTEEYKKLLFFNLQGNRLFHMLLKLSHPLDKSEEIKSNNKVTPKVDPTILDLIEKLPQLLRIDKDENEFIVSIEDRIENHPYYKENEETTDMYSRFHRKHRHTGPRRDTPAQRPL